MQTLVSGMVVVRTVLDADRGGTPLGRVDAGFVPEGWRVARGRIELKVNPMIKGDKSRAPANHLEQLAVAEMRLEEMRSGAVKGIAVSDAMKEIHSFLETRSVSPQVVEDLE
jgi:hypothetical protein